MEAIDRRALLAQGRRLEVFTVFWNSAEGLVSVFFGLLVGSIALVGFGIDSFIEMSSGLILLWRLQTDRDAAMAERAEATALRLIGLSLLLLGVYVVADATGALLNHEPPAVSPPGIVIAGVSLVVMPLLGYRKRRLAVAINSQALVADSFQTSICTWLSGILLGGLLLNALWGWWWADPLAALAMVPLLFREGLAAFRGDRCGDCLACGTPACTCAR